MLVITPPRICAKFHTKRLSSNQKIYIHIYSNKDWDVDFQSLLQLQEPISSQ